MSIKVRRKGEKPDKFTRRARTKVTNSRTIRPEGEHPKSHHQKGKGGRPPKPYAFAESAKPEELPEEFNKIGFKSDAELTDMIHDIDPDKVTHKYNADQVRAQMLMIHRMLIRRSSVDEICKVIGVTTGRYYALRQKLESMIRLDVKKLDLPYYIGDTLALYDEVRSMALVTSSNAQIKDPRIKLRAMEVALQAEREKNGFLQQCGVYGNEVSDAIRKAMEVFGSIPNVVSTDEKNRQEADDILSRAVSVLKSHSEAVQSSDDADIEDGEFADAQTVEG